jgi:hypothetical protein
VANGAPDPSNTGEWTFENFTTAVLPAIRILHTWVDNIETHDALCGKLLELRLTAIVVVRLFHVLRSLSAPFF